MGTKKHMHTLITSLPQLCWPNPNVNGTHDNGTYDKVKSHSDRVQQQIMAFGLQ